MKSRDAARRRSILKLKRRRSSREEDEREGEREREAFSSSNANAPSARTHTSRHAYVHALKKASTFACSGGKRACKHR